MVIGFIACMLSTISSQSDYKQVLSVCLKPRPDKISAFEAGLAAHNKKYHTADPFKAWVWSVNNGKDAGSYWYDLGPCTLTDMDGRKTTPEHDADWNNNVIAHCSELPEAGYWRIENLYSSGDFTRSRLRFFTLKPGQEDRAKKLLSDFAEVLKQKKYPVDYTIYWRLEATPGPHFAAALSFANWSFLDSYDGIGAAFDEIHGKGSFELFNDELEMAVDVSKTFDQHVEFMPNLSSN
jgi:hypothetical protein